ncbi:MAG TPA: metallophosphoesterase [Solirubrobacteraceae bacterium]|nr:metallophosphoesterase [Solirubrobacteraceae bacterium]
MRRLVAILAVVALAVGVYLWAPWRSEPAIRAPGGPYLPSGPQDQATLWAVGDGADGGSAARSVVQRMKRKRFDRLLYLGDVYGSGLVSLLVGDGTAADYRDRYDPLYGEFAAKTAPTPGNHEWRQRGAGYEPYWEEVFGRPPPAFYAFDVAGWQLLSLNTEAPHGARSAQVRWLREQLRATGTCRLAFWHKPRFNAGRYGDEPGIGALWNALRGHARIVVTGHDHNMQRFKPVDAITQYVAGAGGHGRHALRRDRRLAFGNDRDFGALRIELSPGRARTAFVSADGRILDVNTVRCRR